MSEFVNAGRMLHFNHCIGLCMHACVCKIYFYCIVSCLFVRKLSKDIINVSFEAEVCMYIYNYYHIHTYNSCVSFDCT